MPIRRLFANAFDSISRSRDATACINRNSYGRAADLLIAARSRDEVARLARNMACHFARDMALRFRTAITPTLQTPTEMPCTRSRREPPRYPPSLPRSIACIPAVPPPAPGSTRVRSPCGAQPKRDRGALDLHGRIEPRVRGCDHACREEVPGNGIRIERLSQSSKIGSSAGSVRLSFIVIISLCEAR